MTDAAFVPRFVGRERDLENLAQRWHEARSGRPTMVVIRAETGVGKTRLVQEFYRWLNHQADPEGYWPDELGCDGDNLRVDPRFREHHKSTVEIPWLWLGVRFSRPQGRNAPTGVALQDALAQLKPHLRPLLAYEHRKSLVIDAAKDVIGVLAGGIPDAAIAIWNLTHSLLAERRETVRGALPVAAAQEQEERELSEELVHYLGAVLDRQHPGMRSVPIVLVLDDAQWADAHTLSFVESLFRAAHRERWRLLVIVTHWEADWNRLATEAAVPTGQGPPRSVPDLVRRNPDCLGDFAPYDLRKLEATQVECLIRETLPGLTDEQRHAIAARVDGNPEFLSDLLRLILNESRWLVDGRADRPLTPFGARQVQTLLTREHHHMVQHRFSEFSQAMKDALATASHQGMAFLTGVACRAAAGPLGRSEDELRRLHDEAENPHAAVATVGADLREFRQRAMQETARAYLETSLGDRIEDIRRAELDALRATLAHEAASFATPAEEQFALRYGLRLLEAADTVADPVEAAWLRIAFGARLVASLERARLLSLAAEAAESAAAEFVALEAGGSVKTEDLSRGGADLLVLAPRLLLAFRSGPLLHLLEAIERWTAPAAAADDDALCLRVAAWIFRAQLALQDGKAGEALWAIHAAVADLDARPYAAGHSELRLQLLLVESAVFQQLGDHDTARARLEEAARLDPQVFAGTGFAPGTAAMVAPVGSLDDLFGAPEDSLARIDALLDQGKTDHGTKSGTGRDDEAAAQRAGLLLQRGAVLERLRRHAEAVASHGEALELLERLAQDPGSEVGRSWTTRQARARGYGSRAFARLCAGGPFAEAEPDFDRAVALFDELLADACPRPVRREAALTLWRRGNARQAANPGDPAVDDLRRARRLYWSLFCNVVINEGAARDLDTLRRLGADTTARLKASGDTQAALREAEECCILAAAQRALATQAGICGALEGRRLALSKVTAASIRLDLGETNAALAGAEEAEGLLRATVGEIEFDWEKPALLEDIAGCLDLQAEALSRRGETDAAEERRRHAAGLRDVAQSLLDLPATE